MIKKITYLCFSIITSCFAGKEQPGPEMNQQPLASLIVHLENENVFDVAKKLASKMAEKAVFTDEEEKATAREALEAMLKREVIMSLYSNDEAPEEDATRLMHHINKRDQMGLQKSQVDYLQYLFDEALKDCDSDDEILKDSNSKTQQLKSQINSSKNKNLKKLRFKRQIIHKK